jgi:hypothetical protein
MQVVGQGDIDSMDIRVIEESLVIVVDALDAECYRCLLRTLAAGTGDSYEMSVVGPLYGRDDGTCSDKARAKYAPITRHENLFDMKDNSLGKFYHWHTYQARDR